MIQRPARLVILMSVVGAIVACCFALLLVEAKRTDPTTAMPPMRPLAEPEEIQTREAPAKLERFETPTRGEVRNGRYIPPRSGR